MAVKPGLNKTLHPVEAHEDSLVLIPFGCQINGTSDPDHVTGDLIVHTATRNEAGEIVFTLKARPAKVICGFADVSSTADDVDIYGKVDWSTVEVDGTFTVRFMTGSTETDPPDNLLVGGFLLAKKSSRARTGT